MASKTLGDVEQLIPNSMFTRIHKSYLVNLQYLNALQGEPVEVQLSNGIKLPVSRRRVQDVKIALSNRMR